MILLVVALLGFQEDSGRKARALVEKLRSDSVELRAEAEQALDALGDAALPALREAFRDADPDVAFRARRLFHLIPARRRFTPGLRRAVPDLEDRLSGGDPRAWTRLLIDAVPGDFGKGFRDLERLPGLAASDLGAIVPPALAHAKEVDEKLEAWRAADTGWAAGAPAEQLVAALVETHPTVRELAVWTLGRRAIRSAIPAIQPLLADPDPEVRTRAFWGLLELRAPVDLPAMRRLLDDDPSKDALEHLVHRRVREAVPEILARLRDPRGCVRLGYLKALGELADRGLAADLEPLLLDEDPEVRRAAASALGTMGAKEAAGPIRELLQDGDREVRQTAARVLGDLGSKESVPALLLCLEDHESWVVYEALRSLARLGAREAGPQIVLLLRAGRSVRTAAEAAGDLRVQEAEPELRRLLDSNESDRKWVAGYSLAQLALARGPEAARRLLCESSEQLLLCALACYEERKPAGLRDEIVRLLGDPRELVRRAALQALPAWDAAGARPHLLKALADPEGGVRRAALQALLPLAEEEHIPAVLKLLGDPSEDIRVAAASWLCTRGRREGVPVLLARGAFQALNALRRRELWERLRRLAAPKEIGSLTAVALTAGLPLVWPEGEPRAPNKRILDMRETTGNLIEALENAHGPHQAAVLEADRIVLLPPWKAKEFWERWWAEEARK